MVKVFKIKTAWFVCLAFVFRLLFLNLDACAAVGTPVDAFKKSSSKEQNEKSGETVVKPLVTTTEQTVQEFTEDTNENEEDASHVKKVALLFLVFSFLKGTIDAAKAHVSFDSIKCRLYPKKYLTLSVIRI